MGVELQEDEFTTTRRRWPGWSRSVWHRIWWWGSWVLAAVLAASIYTGAVYFNQLFLVGPLLVQTRVVALVLYAGTLVCWWMSLRTMTPAAPGRTRARRVLGRVRTVLAGVLATATVLVGGLYVLLSTWMLATEQYHVLAPASDGGCRLVMSVKRLDWRSSGTLLLAVPGSLVVQDTHYGWVAWGRNVDPFWDGEWSLSWQGRTAHVVVEGDRLGEGIPPRAPYGSLTGMVDCPR